MNTTNISSRGRRFTAAAAAGAALLLAGCGSSSSSSSGAGASASTSGSTAAAPASAGTTTSSSSGGAVASGSGFCASAAAQSRRISTALRSSLKGLGTNSTAARAKEAAVFNSVADQAQSIVDAAPAEIKSDLQTQVAAIRDAATLLGQGKSPVSVLASPKIAQADARLGLWAKKNCPQLNKR